ncbi:helix-turn-helix domain-containing protein [Winogradskyella flava]|uniref:helix-turn-helix domain-containing protein n=1 Tax=Winogradskyella flava TaxID=1884876 RepID=UPI002492172E|nr:helix-turn-helix domain-containing protein [Winogradskyella flava]
MSRKSIFSFTYFAIVLFFFLIVSCSIEENDEFTERVKISLREVGNQLLLSDQDSTSLILPVIALEQSKYRLSFQSELSFQPDDLVSIVHKNFRKSELPKHYRVEVVQCTDSEVAYSYQMSVDEESTIIPCMSRILPKNCYTIEVRFIRRASSLFSKTTIAYIMFFSVLILFALIIYKRKKSETKDQSNNGDYIKIGSFQFYAGQNKLIKEAVEISLSKKECELLEIFVANPNQIIKRDELTKRVWEDQGVFVGRSLDTYISKLRKKLKEDDAIKLTNIHGVGYKLEINKD